MNQLALNRRLLDGEATCAELLGMAQRELAAMFRAVSELFGPEQAEISAEEWLHQVEAIRTLPRSAREWRRITARVIGDLAQRVAIAIPARAQLQPAGY